MTLNFLRSFYLTTPAPPLVTLYTVTPLLSNDNVYPLLPTVFHIAIISVNALYSLSSKPIDNSNTINYKSSLSPVYSMKSFMRALPRAPGIIIDLCEKPELSITDC